MKEKFKQEILLFGSNPEFLASLGIPEELLASLSELSFEELVESVSRMYGEIGTYCRKILGKDFHDISAVVFTPETIREIKSRLSRPREEITSTGGGYEPEEDMSFVDTVFRDDAS